MDPYKILQYPLSTEKAVREMESSNSLLFVVFRNAKKQEIKKATEEAFGVKVLKVRTLVDRENKKRAYIQLSPDTPAIDVTTKLGLI